MSAVDPPASELARTIDTLYAVFARYPAAERVEGCPCCMSAADHAELGRAPLRPMAVPLLRRYAFKAMTTWGDAGDFKHFLPAIWDRMSRGELEIDEQTIHGKLPYASWAQWPERERAAIVAVTHAWLRAALGGDRAWLLDTIVESAGHAGIPVAPLIEIAETSAGPYLANAIAGLAGRLQGTERFAWIWWKTDREQLLARWVRERGPAKLETALREHPSHVDAWRWSAALDALAWPAR